MKGPPVCSIRDLLRACPAVAALVALLGCARTPPPSSSAGGYEGPSASGAPPSPTPCEQAASFRASAQAAFAEGHLLRAWRRLDAAAGRCPGEDAAALGLKWRVACSLLSPERVAAVRGQECSPFAEDAPPGVTPSTDLEGDYRRAVGAFMSRRLDEAGQLAVRVAMRDGDLRLHALLLAARAAELQGRTVVANRMLARAADTGTKLVAKEPVDDPRTLARAYPGLQWTGRSCLGPPDDVALTPDGHGFARRTGGRVAIYSVEERFLTDWFSVAPEDAELVCLGEGGRVLMDERSRPALLRLGPEGGKVQRVRAHTAGVERPAFVGPDGAVYVRKIEDSSGARAWYWARPDDAAFRRVKGTVAGVAPDGAVVGLISEGSKSYVARFDPATGKARARTADPVDWGWAVASRNGRRLFTLSGSDFAIVDLESWAARPVSLPARMRPEDWIGDSRVVLRDEDDGSLWTLDAQHGAIEPAGTTVWTGKLFQGSGRSHFFMRRADGVVAFDIPRAKPSFFSPGYRPEDAALSSDGRWLAVAGPHEVVVVDVRDPDHPVAVQRKTVGHSSVWFDGASTTLVIRPEQASREHWMAYDAAAGKDVAVPAARPEIPAPPRPRCAGEENRATRGDPDHVEKAPSGAQVYQCGATLRRLEGNPNAAPVVLGRLPIDQGWLTLVGWDESTGVMLVEKRLKSEGGKKSHELRFMRFVDGNPQSIRLAFALGASGGMAIDDEGYYEFFGDVPAAFRASASCAGDYPVEMCADRWEAPGMLVKFIHGDFSYRDP